MTDNDKQPSRVDGLKQRTKGQGFLTFVIVLGMLCTVGVALLASVPALCLTFFQRENNEMLGALTKLVRDSDDQYVESSNLFFGNAYGRASLMASALSEFVTPEGDYTGPRFFGDGVVVEVVDGELVFPDEMPPGFIALSREELEDSATNATILAKPLPSSYSTLVMDDESIRFLSETSDESAEETAAEANEASGVDEASGANEASGEMEEAAENVEVTEQPIVDSEEEIQPTSEPLETDEGADDAYYLVKRIADNLYYVDITTNDALYEYAVGQSYVFLQLQAIEKAFNRGILVVNDALEYGDETMYLSADSSHFVGAKTASELGFTRDDLLQEKTLVFTTKGPYLCSYQRITGRGLILIYASPVQDLIMSSTSSGVFMLAALLLILVAFILYLLELPRYVTGRELTEEERLRYHPQEVRSNLIAAGIACGLLIFAMGFLAQNLGYLRTEIIEGRRVTSTIFDGIEEGVTQRDTRVEEAEGEWYARYARRMANLFSRYPELVSDEKLREYCDALGVDYIMVFDAQGNEIACNKNYTGFSLGDGEGDNADALRCLLNGVSTVVCKMSTNSVTGVRSQVVGASIPKAAGRGVSGALVISIPPERVREASGDASVNDELAAVCPKETLLFSANEEDGVINYTSNLSMVGTTVSECGLSDRSLRDGYMDHSVVNGNNCFVVTSKSGSDINYYAVKDSNAIEMSIIFGIASALCFAIILPVVLYRLLKDYTVEWYEREVSVEQNEGIPDVVAISEGSTSDKDDKSDGVWPLVKKASMGDKAWDKRTPEERVGFVMGISLFVMTLLICFYEMVLSSSFYHDESPLLSFILYGDWMRGANIFALCSIIMTFGVAFFAYNALKRVLQLISSFLDAKGKTICRLLISFFRYLAYALVVYLSFSYLGFPASTIVGSLGLVGMAISLGSKDLVSDIVAGIFIVFEDQFQVGDIIEVGGFKGVVKEIGVRSTKIINDAGNVKTVGNMDIKNVLNMTKYDSVFVQTLKIPMGGSLNQVEDALRAGLPSIAERCDKILTGPTYEGVSDITGGVMTVAVSVGCHEQDSKEVLRFLNRELILLCESRDIPIK